MAVAEVSPLIEARGLIKAYDGKRVVDGIDLAVPAGEVFGLLGPNGAGKTTTILMLLGLTEPTDGSIRVCGLDPARDPVAVKRRVGFLPDAVGFYPDLTARQNLRYTARLNEIPGSETEDQIESLLATVGLDADADQAVGTYSRGMKQRLGVADCLLKDPDVVVLDEPTASIDPAGVVEILALINRLAREEGRAVLLSSHLLNQVQEVCDRVGIFVKGKLVAEGSPEELARGLGESGAVYELWVDAARDELAAALGGHVTAIEPIGTGRWKVTVPDRDISAMIRSLLQSGLELRQIRDLGLNLDQIYQRYFQGGQE